VRRPRGETSRGCAVDAFFPAVVALDRGWRRFVDLVAGRAAALDRTAGAARTDQALLPPPNPGEPATAARRRFHAAGYRPKSVPTRVTTATAPAPAPATAFAGPPSAEGAVPAHPGEPSHGTEPLPAPLQNAVAPDPAPAREPVDASALAAHLDERRAQAAALRALLLARQRRYAEAESAFAQAAGLDPALDLGTLDGFWELERGAHAAAVRAYEAVGRHRDAMGLRATLDGRYRPRLVRTA
jgi:hypothetical protein